MEALDKKEYILNIAEELFAHQGFEGTSVRELCKKAGVNVAMISYYFGSKEQLMEALIEHRAGFMRDRLDSLVGEKISAKQKMELVIEYYVERIFSNSKYHKILHHEISLQQRSQFNIMISAIVNKNFNAIREIIKQGQKSGEFKKVDIELTIVTIIGTISHIILSPVLTSQILSNNQKSFDMFSKKNQTRVKDHLKSFVINYLQKK